MNETEDQFIKDCQFANDLWMSMLSALNHSYLRSHGQQMTAGLRGPGAREHQLAYFLQGLKALGLMKEPTDAIRCAKYHYLTNSLAGMDMEYVEETPNKVWIRYRAPSWICDSISSPGTGLASFGAAHGQVGFAAWHANNGTLLGNPRLVYVQTQSIQEGDPWDAGYFTELDQDVALADKFVRRPWEWGPRFDPAKAPKLEGPEWNEERRAKLLRNYGIRFSATLMRTITMEHGVMGAAEIIRHASCILFVQRFKAIKAYLGVEDVSTPEGAATLLVRMLTACGDSAQIKLDGQDALVTHDRCRLQQAFPELPDELYGAWAYGARPLLRLCDMDLRHRVDAIEPGVYQWRFLLER